MSPRRLVPFLLVSAALCVLLTTGVVALRPSREPAGARAEAAPLSAVESEPRRVLDAWDRARARAWAQGDPIALRELYLPGSGAGASDVRMLGTWSSRGLKVQGMQTQVLAFAVISESATRLEVLVTDRVIGGEAVDAEGTRSLPADRPSTRALTLRKVAGRWVMATVTDQRR